MLIHGPLRHILGARADNPPAKPPGRKERTTLPRLARTETTPSRRLPPFLPLALLAACGDAGDGTAAGAAGTLDGPDVILNAVTEEVFTVGSVTGDDWDTFGTVRSVHFDALANLHVFDLQAEHIRVVGPDGSLVRTVGGRGEGPGEFANVTTAIVARDGSYTVLAFSHIDLLDSEGEYVRRVTMDPMTTGIVIANLAFPDGRLLAGAIMRFGEEEEEEEEGHPIHIFPLDGNEPEVLYTAWRPPDEDQEGPSVGGSRETGMRVAWSAGRAFEPYVSYAPLTDGRVALIDSIGYRVKLIGLEGSVAGTIERPIAPLAVDDAMMEAARARYRETMAAGESLTRTGSPIEIEMEGVEGLTFADQVPVLHGLEVDWEDRIWVRRRGPTGDDDGPIDIVTPEGEYVGTLPPDGLRTPDAFGPDGLMAYIERDEMDVQTVRVVRLLALEPEG